MGKTFNASGGGGGGGIKLASIAIITPPTKTSYLSGEVFDPSGMVVRATYSNGATATATGYNFIPYGGLTDGTTAVTIQYTEGGVTRTASQPVTVIHKLTGLSITTNPSKMVYEYQDSFAPAGMVVTAGYSDGATASVTSYTYSPTALNAVGSQAITVSYAENGVAKTATLTVTVERKSLPSVPAQSGTLTYTGVAQTPSWTGYDSNTMTLAVTAQTNAGSYTASFTPKSNYRWPDGTTAAKSVPWVICRATISAVPSQSGTLTYTGNSQSPTWNNYDPAKMTIGGTTSGTNAGSYNATFTPDANHQWAGSITTSQTVSWSIGKAAGSMTLSKTSVTLNADAASDTITVTRSGDGAIGAVSDNTSVAAVSVSGNVVTISSVGDTTGTATVTISVGESQNYLAAAGQTVSVSAEFMPAIGTPLNDFTWEQIKSISDANQGANYWAVGDKKTTTLNGKIAALSLSNLSIDAFIIGFNHNSPKEGSNRIHWLFGKISNKDAALCDSNYNSYGSSAAFRMNTSDTNSGGWNGSYMRKTVLGNSNSPSSPLANSFMAAMESGLRAVLKTITKYTDNTGNANSNSSSAVTATTDYLFLLAEFEVFGTRYHANNYEQNYQLQYDYFKAGNSRVAYKHSAVSTAVWWWLRSAFYYYSYNFCSVYTDGSINHYSANYSAGLRVGFAT